MLSSSHAQNVEQLAALEYCCAACGSLRTLNCSIVAGNVRVNSTRRSRRAAAAILQDYALNKHCAITQHKETVILKYPSTKAKVWVIVIGKQRFPPGFATTLKAQQLRFGCVRFSVDDLEPCWLEARLCDKREGLPWHAATVYNSQCSAVALRQYFPFYTHKPRQPMNERPCYDATHTHTQRIESPTNRSMTCTSTHW